MQIVKSNCHNNYKHVFTELRKHLNTSVISDVNDSSQNYCGDMNFLKELGVYNMKHKHHTMISRIVGSEPFSSALRMSNIKQYKYDWVWVKNVSTNFLHAKRQPLRNTENIHVFYKKCGKYYPIKSTGHTPTQSAKGCSNGVLYHGKNTRNYSGGETTRYPKTTIEFDVVDLKNRLHPTQKPVALLEYLIKTYTQEGETVLDFTFGSCSTGVACLNTNRKFIGIEMEEKYFDIGVNRMQESIMKGEK